MDTFFVLNDKEDFKTDPQYAGNVIFYKKSKDASIAAVQQDLFSKLISKALQLPLQQFLFIDVASTSPRFATIHKEIGIKKCFLFGVNENEIGLNATIPFYQLTKIINTDFIKADAPEVLEKDKNKKSKLWQQLLITFNIQA
ncbi:MAG: hypothetical protein RJA25_1562 [Bacteroidota bacterium]|jgi:hypothetical protein